MKTLAFGNVRERCEASRTALAVRAASRKRGPEQLSLEQVEESPTSHVVQVAQHLVAQHLVLVVPVVLVVLVVDSYRS